MSTPTQLTVKPTRQALVVGFRSSTLLNNAVIVNTGRELLDICDLALDCERRILLNFEGVNSCCSAMIGKIVLLNKKAKHHRISIKICNVSPQIMRVFEITRVNKAFPVVDYKENDDEDDEGPEALGCRVPKPTSPSNDSAGVGLPEEVPDDDDR